MLTNDADFWMMCRDRVLCDGLSRKQAKGRDRGFAEQLARVGINPRFTFPAVALFEPAGHGDAGGQSAASLRSALDKLLPSGAVSFVNDRGQVGLLFSWWSSGWIESLHQQLGESLDTLPTVGVGKPCNRLADAWNSHAQAAAALRHRFYRGLGGVIHFAEVPPLQSLRAYPLQKEKELFERMMKAEEPSAIAKAVGDFYKSLLREGPIAVDHVYEVTIRMLAGMEKRLFHDAKTPQVQIRHEMKAVFKQDTLKQVENFVAQYLSDLKAEVRYQEKESHRSIIQKTIGYMESECQHATLDSVAKRVYMTPTYLSMLFRVNTGKTFIEQLTDIRINKAKEMLRNTHLKNYEVAERVGYRDSRYFSQIFKKKVGLSPSEYRESMMR
jgi:AraC-like DNA-binding protein